MSNPPVVAQTKPSVSVIMAHHDGKDYIGAAIASVLGQSLGALELILSDDASTDGSREIAQAAAASDPRVKVVRSDRRGGPAVARNRALDMARGDWIAIVDADDLIHPERLERLVAQATSLGAQVIADDLIYFGADSGRTLLAAKELDRPWTPTTAEFLAVETGRPAIPVGYLKPLFRRHAIGDLRYRPYLTVGEDFDLLFRVLLAGARLVVLPDALYFYRRHAASISHRLSGDDLKGMLRAIDDLCREMPEATHDLSDLLERRRQSMALAARFAALVRQLKARDGRGAARLVAQTPRLVMPLARAAGESVGRRLFPGLKTNGNPCLELVSEIRQIRPTPNFRRVAVPDTPAGWTAARAAAMAAQAGQGNARLRVIGRAGLDALGYVPGWAMAELVPPAAGWTPREAARIARLNWPTTQMTEPAPADARKRLSAR